MTINLYVPAECGEWVSAVTGVGRGEILTEHGSVPFTWPVVRSIARTSLIRAGMLPLRVHGARVTAVVSDETGTPIEVHTTNGRVPAADVPMLSVLR